MASIIVSRSVDAWDSTPFLIYVAIVVIAVATFVIVSAGYWRLFAQWVQGLRGRDWPTVSATIDIVSVVKQVTATGKGDIVIYLAMLTYFYRNPDLQTGEYCREFNEDEEADAQAWASSYKGSAVLVHVDPRDPARSVLRKEVL
jgi:hypothetical protein